MARSYDVPPSTAEKEKAIGGILTFVQFGWLIGGLVVAMLVFLAFYIPTKSYIVGGIFAVPVALIGVPFAFYKKYEMSLISYLFTKDKFKYKTKKLLNKH